MIHRKDIPHSREINYCNNIYCSANLLMAVANLKLIMSALVGSSEPTHITRQKTEIHA